MTNSGNPESADQIQEAPQIDTLEHVLCGGCTPPDYICGTRRAGDEVIVKMGSLKPDSPCVVCFGSDFAVCNACDEVIEVTLP